MFIGRKKKLRRTSYLFFIMVVSIFGFFGFSEHAEAMGSIELSGQNKISWTLPGELYFSGEVATCELIETFDKNGELVQQYTQSSILGSGINFFKHQTTTMTIPDFSKDLIPEDGKAIFHISLKASIYSKGSGWGWFASYDLVEKVNKIYQISMSK